MFFDAWRLGQPLELLQKQRLAVVGLNSVLAFSVAGSLLFASHVVAVQRTFIATMFGDGVATDATHGRYNILLLGGDSGADRWGLRPDSISVASIDEETGRAILFGLPRNMKNFPLLRELGRTRKPVLVKRGISATIEEWLLSAEYVLAGGNADVMLCERGIRTFESYTRNTLDISAIPVVQKLSHLPVVVDPSHGTGRRDKVAPMARAAVAAGADGLLIEVHCDPDHALSDGAQSLFPTQFERLMAELRIIAPAIGRSICVEPVARRGWAR